MSKLLHNLRAASGARAVITEATGGQKIVIDYSSPNIAKQFHIGNLRCTLIGRYLDKVHRKLGHDVTSINYLGDWGTQFAMIAAYWPQMRPSDGFWNSLSPTEKIRSLTDCYVVANKKSKDDEDFREEVRRTYMQMEKDLRSSNYDSESLKLWLNIKSISEEHLREFYRILDIQFDHWMCESAHVKEAYELVDELIKQNKVRLLTDGRYVHDMPKEQYAILRKSDDTSLYLSRELAAIQKRDALFNADRYIYVVDRSQRGHFEALKLLLQRIGKEELAAKIEHASFGRVRGLSTRLGRTEAVSDILARGTELAMEFMKTSKTVKVGEEQMEDIARKLSVSTIVFQDLKRARNAEYEFSFNNAFHLNQNNALFLQMKHTRLVSIEERNAELMQQLDSCQDLPEQSQEVAQLMTQLLHTEKVVAESADSLEPCKLTLHLVQLAHSIGTVSAVLKVKDQPKEIALPRLLLLSTCRSVLSDGMRLLGMLPVDQM